MPSSLSSAYLPPETLAPARSADDNPVRTIVAVSIGNALEWFDIVVYGFLAATIAKLFFPAGNDTVSLLLTFGTFGVSFLMRPLGSVVLGAYADRAGRKRALTLSIGLMTLGTFIIAVAPTYAAIGVAAPVILIIARLLQGFSAGGEFGSATAFLAEQNPARRGFYSSWQAASQGLTTLLASGFGVALSTLLDPAQLTSWGWRIPFVFGLLVGPVAVYIRSTLHEGDEYRATLPTASPLQTALAGQKLRMLIGAGLIVMVTVSAYTMLFMPTFAIRQLGIAPSAGFTATLIFGALQFILCPIFGQWSDRIGRLPIMTTAAALMLVLIVPLFVLLNAYPSLAVLCFMQAVMATLASAYFGASSAAMSELFPAGTRSTGLSISYSFGVAIFGGFAPFIVAWLIGATGSNPAPGFYVAFGAALSLLALAGARKAGVR
jgi:MHS family proline/betaine transporter-like MFS transporter